MPEEKTVEGLLRQPRPWMLDSLAAEFGITDYPSPAGGCRLTEDGFGRRLKDLMEHEGLGDRRLVELLVVGRRFRLPGGSSLILGRDRVENERLRQTGYVLVECSTVGPVAAIPELKREDDRALAQKLVDAYAKGTSERDRLPYKPCQIL